MNQQNQPPVDDNFDFSQTEAIETWSGDTVWQSGFILRKVPKNITGTNEEAVIPIQVFFDPKTGKILDNTLPKSLRDVLNGNSSSSSNIHFNQSENTTNPNEPQPFQWNPTPENQPEQAPSTETGGIVWK